MAIQMTAFSASAAGLNAIERGTWDVLKIKMLPYIWQWYDAHKNQKVTTILKVYTITIGSFGIAEAIITHLFGERPVTI